MSGSGELHDDFQRKIMISRGYVQVRQEEELSGEEELWSGSEEEDLSERFVRGRGVLRVGGR